MKTCWLVPFDLGQSRVTIHTPHTPVLALPATYLRSYGCAVAGLGAWQCVVPDHVKGLGRRIGAGLADVDWRDFGCQRAMDCPAGLGW